MSDYLQDLVQNIYTNCDMKGFDDYNRGIKNLNANTTKSLKQRLNLLEQENKKMSERNNILKQASKIFLGYFSYRTLKNVVNTGSKLQLVQKSIEGLTKSTQDWDFIQQQAFKTGTDIEVVARGYRNFFSSARMAGFDKEGIQSMYSDLLISTRAIGATTQQTEGALLALEQMISKGTVSMEELRRQLGNALPGAFEIGAKAMNMTTMEFNKFVRTGQLASAEFVPKFVAQLKKEYAGGFQEISETVDFALTNLRNAWKRITLEIVRSSVGREFAKLINSLTQKLTSPSFINSLKIISTVLSKIVGLVRWLVEHLPQLMPFLAPALYLGVISGIIGIGKSIVQATRALMGANIVIGSMTASTAALYMNLVGILAWALLIEDAFRGFPTWKRMAEEFNKGKNVNKYDQGVNIKPFESDKFIYYANNGKIFRVGKEMYSYEGTRDKAGNLINPSTRLKNQWEQFGRAHEVQILPNKQVFDKSEGKVTGLAANLGYSGELPNLTKEEANDYTITMGDVIFNINGAGDPKAVAEEINLQFSNLLIGQMGGVTE